MEFVILICTLGLARASFDYNGRPTLADLKKFYGTNQLIYTWKRSFRFDGEGNSPVICVSNQKEKDSGEEDKLYLKEAYGLGTKVYYYRVAMSLTGGNGRDDAPVMEAKPGRFKWSTSQAGMKVQEGSQSDQQIQTRKYRFEYHDSDKRCAVVTFNDDITLTWRYSR
uniref:Lipocalin n=1 Tax=Rhipicephalus zambeziensis TaxID=60191 RepID=A0A224YHQ5_9ACAR